MGTGGIALKMAESLAHAKQAVLAGVASRQAGRGRLFIEQLRSGSLNAGMVQAYNSYQELLDDDRIDLVYVASPHPFHAQHALLALRANKHILVEKPLALNAEQAQSIIVEARSRGLFLMEAMWTRFLPAIDYARELILGGSLGALRSIEADLGFDFPFDANNRFYNLALGGGALLDLGIYPLSIASYFAGPAREVQAVCKLSPSGVDSSDAISVLHYSGVVSSLSCSMEALSAGCARLYCERGSVTLQRLFIAAKEVTVSQGWDGPNETFDFSYPGPGLHFEVDEIAHCIGSGLLESPRMPLDESLALSRTMDKILASAGVSYPI